MTWAKSTRSLLVLGVLVLLNTASCSMDTARAQHRMLKDNEAVKSGDRVADKPSPIATEPLLFNATAGGEKPAGMLADSVVPAKPAALPRNKPVPMIEEPKR